MSDNIDINSRFGNDGEAVKISENERMKLGKQVLFFIGLFVLLVCGAYIYQPDNTATSAIFELVKIGALPLVTLIISFYFPNSQNN